MGLADIIKSLRGVGSNVANEGASALLPDFYKEKIAPYLRGVGGDIQESGVVPQAQEYLEGLGSDYYDASHPGGGLYQAGVGLQQSGDVPNTMLNLNRLGTNWGGDIQNATNRWFNPSSNNTSIQSQNATSGEAEAAADQTAISNQNREGMGINNIAGRHGSFPLLKPPHGTNRVLDGGAPVEVREQSVTIEDLLPALGFGDKRQGTTYDGSIEGGGWFTPEEYQRNYSRFGRGA